MKNEIAVLITHKIAKGSEYRDVLDCPLARVVKRMFPESFVVVGSNEIDISLSIYKVNTKEWSPSICDKVISGEISSVKTTLTLID